jgi:nitroreductase
MNEAYQNLLNRFSTKKYTDQPVSDEILDAILEAGLYAPTGKNNQKAIMVAVRDKATRDQLSRMNAEIMGAQLDPFYGAPCVVVVLSDPTWNTWVEDGSLVMGNLMNAATALGLGSCWIHRAREMFDSPEGKELLEKWGLPTTLRGIGNCVLGYSAGEPVKKPRAENRIFKVD